MYIIPRPLCLRSIHPNQSNHLPSILETTRLITSRERRPVHRTRADLYSTFLRSISEPSSSHRHHHRPCPHLTSLPPPLCLRPTPWDDISYNSQNPHSTSRGLRAYEARYTRTLRSHIITIYPGSCSVLDRSLRVLGVLNDLEFHTLPKWQR